MHATAAELSSAINQDAASYDAVLTAFKLPKDTPEDARHREEAIQQATRGAAEVPLSVARKAVEIYERLGQLESISSASMLSDLRVARLMAAAGARGALANVAINLDSIMDDTFVASMRKQSSEIESRLSASSAHA